MATTPSDVSLPPAPRAETPARRGNDVKPRASERDKAGFSEALAQASAEGKTSETRSVNKESPLAAKPEKKPNQLGNETSKDATSEQAEPKASEAANAPLAKNGTKLQGLKKAAATNKQAIEQNPAIALLTGKLEKLNPDEIPSLVSSNGFLTKALSEADLQGFMNRPLPAMQLLEALGLPTKLLDEAQTLSAEQVDELSPSDMLRAIGVDPQRVLQELRVLKESLPLDGLSGYVKRSIALNQGSDAAAAKAAAKGQVPDYGASNAKAKIEGRLPSRMAAPSNLAPTQNMSLGNEDPAPKAIPADGMAMWMALSQTLTASAPALAGQATPKDLADQPRAHSELTQTLPKAANMAPTSILPSTDLAPVEGGSLVSGLPVAPEPLSSIPTPTEGNGEAAAPVDQSGALPGMHQASYDAFQTLGTRMHATKSRDFSTDLDPPATRQAVPELTTPEATEGALPIWTKLVSQQEPTAPGPFVNRLEPTATLAAPLTRPMNAQTLIATAPETKPGDLLHRIIQDQALKQEQKDSGTFAATSPISAVKVQELATTKHLSPAPGESKDATGPKLISVDELQLGPNLGRGEPRSFDQDKQQDQGDRGREFQTPSGLEQISLTMPSRQTDSVPSTSFASPLLSDSSPSINQNQRFELMQQVLDRASYLAGVGGGSVRLELGSRDLGTIELAVQLKDDKLDLRILTATDRSRDLVAQGLSGLNDMLGTQNLRLGQVDVGVQHRQQESAPNSSQSGWSFQGHDQGQHRAHTWSSDVQTRADALKRSVPVRPPIGAPLAASVKSSSLHIHA